MIIKQRKLQKTERWFFELKSPDIPEAKSRKIEKLCQKKKRLFAKRLYTAKWHLADITNTGQRFAYFPSK